MGVKLGEVSSDQTLENDFRIGVSEQLVDWMLSNSRFNRNLSPEQLHLMRQSVVERLRKKYPNPGIQLRDEWGCNGRHSISHRRYA